MGINLLNENEYFECPNCKGKRFVSSELFTLKRKETSEGTVMIKGDKKILYKCFDCNNEVTNTVGKYKIY